MNLNELCENDKEIVKSIALSMVTSENSIDDILFQCIVKAYEMYKLKNNNDILKLICTYLLVYFELGFDYQKHYDAFDSILQHLNINKNTLIHAITSETVKRPLSKAKVRSMIGRWFPPRKNQMTINQVIDDIISKVENNVEGCYYYHTGISDCNTSGQYSYKLVVSKNSATFYDINRKKFFIL